MTKVTNTQIRGHCQCCGREQAVPSAHMSKHGYTVEGGWFSGVCSGEHHAPVEVSRAQTDAIVAQIAEDVVKLLAKADAFRNGERTPEVISTNRFIWVNGKSSRVTIAFADGDKYQQADAVKSAAWACESRARSGTDFASMLEVQASKHHGQPLITVTKAAPAARIEDGERRVLATGKVATSTGQNGSRVDWYFLKEGSASKFRGWTGLNAWRSLQIV